MKSVAGVQPSRQAQRPEEPSPGPAPAAALGSYRARAETWLRTAVYPALFDRTGSQADGAFWATHAVRSSPGGVAVLMARSPEARGRQVELAYDIGLGRAPANADRTFWAKRLESGWSNDRVVSHLLGSAESLAKHGRGTDWVGWVYGQLLGRAGGAEERAGWARRMAEGQSHDWVARQIGATLEARARTVRVTYQAVRGRLPAANELASGTSSLRLSYGDVMRLRAEITGALAPGGYRVGVVGDSIAFDLEYGSRGEDLPAIVSAAGRPVPAARVGCGVLSGLPGYMWPGRDVLVTPLGAKWGLSGDGKCVEEIRAREEAMLDQRPRVVVWPIGAWEWTPVKRPDGVVLAARSAGLRSRLVLEMARRIDLWAARGVRRVLLLEWACVGRASHPTLRSPELVAFIRSVLDEVVAQRPAVAAVAVTPAEVCVGGNPAGTPTPAHRVARGDGYHWLRGRRGAAWGWTWWMAPAAAELPGVVP
jgi:hypothetical protein